MHRTKDFWDCHKRFDNKEEDKCADDLVRGIMELAEVITLTVHWPHDLKATLDPLFAFVIRLLALVDEMLDSFGAYCTAKLKATATSGLMMAQGD